MKKISIILILFSLFLLLGLSGILAQETEIKQNTQNIELSLNISNTIKSDATDIIVNLTFFPRQEDRQQVTLKTIPEAQQITEEFILFNFSKKGEIPFKVETTVDTKFFFKELKRNVSLINLSVPPELEVYTEESKYVLLDPYIRNKARQLATKDAVETLYNLGEYVRRNMNYSITQMKVENSSWIMENKRGVCSHYTILFMALARSLGIPARFVSGVAYSNKDKVLREHAWAEVWLPEEGWIPYDITFGQYGWLDASHIIMKRSADVSSSAEYSYRGSIEIENLTINTSIIKRSGNARVPLEIRAFSYRESSGFDSYIPFEITIKNPNDYYVSVPVRVSVAPDVFGEKEKIAFIRPHDETKVFFIIHIPQLEECELGCLAELAVEDSFGNSDGTEILIERNKPYVSLREAEEIVRAYSIKRESEIDFYCKSEKEYYYDYENVSVICHAKSPNDVYVSICNQNICKNLTLYEEQSNEVSLEIPAVVSNDTVQMQCVMLCIITREQRDVIAVSCVDTKLLATPEANITDIKDTETSYGSSGNLQLVIDTNVALSANLSIATDKYSESTPIFLKKGSNIMPIEMKTWKMDVGNNDIHVSIEHEDKNGRHYTSERDFVFAVKDVNIFEKILVKITHLFD